MTTRLIPTQDPNALAQAVDILKANGTLVFPTDTVYGLGAMAFQPEGIKKLFEIKGREQTHAIAVLLGQAEDLSQVTENLSPEAACLAENFWPGPLTLVMPKHPNLPDILSPRPTVGVRIPNHPTAIALMKQTGPLAVTSANLTGGKDANTADEAFSQLGSKVDLILDGGKTPGGVPSTVVDLTGAQFQILRQGPISAKDIRAALSTL